MAGQRPDLTYDDFLTVEGPEVDRAYREAQGPDRPTEADIRHTAYRRLVEGWSHQAILADIRNPGSGRPGGGEVPPDPERPKPLTRDQVRTIRGIFSLGKDVFDYWSGAMDQAAFDALVAGHLARGDTHVLIGLQSNGYRSLPGFNFWADPTPVVTRAIQLRAKGLIPTWVLHDDTALDAPAGARAAVYAGHWAHVADAIRPWVDIVVPAFEWNDHLTPAEQDQLLRVLADLFPAAYRLVSFTDDRWAGANAVAGSGQPDGPLPDAWRGGEYGFWVAMRGIVHGLAFQAGLSQIDDDRDRYRTLRGRLAELVLRLNGTRQPDFPDAEADFDRKFGGRPAGDFDVHLWEGGAELVIQGKRGLAWADQAGAAALTVPGVIGAGDGWKG